MSSKLNIYKAVLASLTAAQAGSGSLSFVKNIYNNAFTDPIQIPANACPAIMLEPDEDDEEFFTTGTPPALKSKFKIFIGCVLYEASPGAGLIGDPAHTPPIIGLIEFKDRVKQILQSDMTLGGGLGMQKISFPSAKFHYANYPMRECKISVLLESQLTTTAH
jgi:hypothetical protein